MTNLPGHRDAWLEIDLGAISANADALRSLLPSATRLMAVVKANAYGHGAVPVALALQRAGFDAFGVATLDEALTLRNAGVDGRVIVLYDVPVPALRTAVAASLELSVGSALALRAAVALAPATRPLLHLKIDTGMTRQGLRPEQIGPLADELTAAAPSITGIWTHLRDGADAASSGAQRAIFSSVVATLERLGVHGERHVSASAAILAGAVADEEVARPGMALYGALPDEFRAAGLASPIGLRPAMAVRARAERVAAVPAGTPVGYGGTFVTDAPSVIATLPLGYADGMPRTLSNGRGSALARGQRVPIVGRISMDSLAVDVTSLAGIGHEEVFTLLGNDGGEAITMEELATAAGTIPQEVAVRLDGRLPRTYR